MTNGVLPRRYLCLWLPFLAADRWRHETGSQEKRPLVFVEKVGSVSRLMAVDAHAQSCGLLPGSTLADARARIPQLHALSNNPEAHAAYLKHLADLANAVTPSVALDAPDGLALDITGCAHLFAGEAGLAERLQKVLQAAGASCVRMAVAPTPDMARALARFARVSPYFVNDSALVRTLPIAALECASEDAVALKRAGLKTIADVANRPSVLFTARFTSAFTGKLARVLGEEDRRISPMKSVPLVRTEHRCAEPVISQDVIEAILTLLVAKAGDALHARGEGGRTFEALFLRSDGAVRRVCIETSLPTRDADVVMRLFHDRLNALVDPLDPGFGFDVIRLAVLCAERCIESQTTLDARAEQDDQTMQLIDRLSTVFGSENITRLRPGDTHIPERAQVIVPAMAGSLPQSRCKDWIASGSDSSRPILLYRQPHAIEVETDTKEEPVVLRWRRVAHRLGAINGPERIADEWWCTPSGYGTRDYFRVESENGQRFWIFRSDATAAVPSQRKWFLHGLFP
ncbi:Y-family DNA polymerase [Hyphomicrobium sulfonivorans]|nr:DNA polymerase Y family protein [Hyphomicrobium sulfonivorans]